MKVVFWGSRKEEHTADVWIFYNHFDAVLFENDSGADAGELEELWGLEGAGAEYYFSQGRDLTC